MQKKEQKDIFGQMNTKDKLIALERIIEYEIREFLIKDGGDIEILDLKENGEDIDVYIRYLGACEGCASANSTTLFFIEDILKKELYDKIRVTAV